MSAWTITMMMMMMMDEEEDEEIVSPADRTHELIGDGSQPYALPTINSKHDRFKRIDAATLVRLIDGNFRDMIESFTIVDCRYPYEYQGGHIVNSINVHTGNELVKLFIDKKPNAHHQQQQQQLPNQAPTNQASQQPQQTPRHIIIFHCEFSSERGPRLMRLLREKDRQINKYPELLHPELYLLDGGYREFYKRYKEYCVPQAYKPMKSRNHREELKNYRKRRRIAQPRRKENRTPDISFEG